MGSGGVTEVEERLSLDDGVGDGDGMLVHEDEEERRREEP